MRLQLFGFRESRYERPTLNYCCGGEMQCTMGPDANGACRAGPMCQPTKVGELYKCARSPVAGGPCEAGPGPKGQCGCVVPTCVPRPTMRVRRGRMARWATLVAVAVVLIALSESSRDVWLAGPLSSGHREIGECSQCHANASESASLWLHQAFTPTDPVAASQSCTTCHDRGGEALAMAPHNQPPDVLERWRQSGTSRAMTGGEMSTPLLASVQISDSGPVACASCHREHRGGVDFTAMSDAGCQSCHTMKFEAFPDDHPDFGSYPYRERQDIAFNHASHIDRHFPEADAALRPENCTSCHVADSIGRGMLTTGYESTCASCHDGDIRKRPASGPPGRPFLAVPGMDLKTLATEGVAIGFWPDSFYDRGIPPVMQALLSVGYMDPAKLALLQDVDLLDLTTASPEVLEAVATFAWATKTMMADILHVGVLGDADMMREIFGVTLNATQISGLGGSVPRDVLASAAESWFGCTLYSELAGFRAGDRAATVTLEEQIDGKPPACVDVAADDTASAEADTGGEAAAIRDDVAVSALDALLGSPLDGADGGDILGGSDPGGGDILGGSDLGGGDILGGSDPSGGDILGGSDPGGGDILGGSDLGGGDILGGSGPDGGADSILGGIGNELSEAQEQGQADSGLKDVEPEPVDPAEWARYGGWYRTAEAIYYRPVEHADRFLHAWLDFAGVASGTPGGRALGQAIFEEMGQSGSPGRCAKCHGAERQADGSVVMNWKSERIDVAVSRVTEFRHAPHLTIAVNEGCNLCHEVTPGDAMMASFESFDVADFTPGFAAMTKDTCASCHATKEAGSECQHCHNYHVGEFSNARRMGELTTTGTATEP